MLSRKLKNPATWGLLWSLIYLHKEIARSLGILNLPRGSHFSTEVENTEIVRGELFPDD